MFASFTYRQKTIVYAIMAAYTLVFCSISFVNHYLFRTSAYDLGIYNHVMYSFSHLKMNYATIQQPDIYHIFADHFEPIFFLFSPLYYLFGSYTLLVIQIVFIVAGGIGMMRYALIISKSFNLSLAILIQFYSMWGIYSALSFDFHNNVTAAMLLPWLLVFVEEKKVGASFFIWLLMLLSKENMALFTAFVCFGLGLHYFKQKRMRYLLWAAGIVSLAYFVFIVKFFIPSFLPQNHHYIYERSYDALGTSFGDALVRVATKPFYVLSLLFQHPNWPPEYTAIKMEFHIAVLVSGGIFLFFKPQFWVMLIPIYAQKLFINEPTRWGINAHYSIELIPVVTAATLFFIHQNIHHIRIKQFLPWAVVFATVYHTYTKVKSRKSVWYEAVYTNILLPAHYKTSFDVNKAKEQLLQFNHNESISAQTDLVPRLTNRDSIYLYPKIYNARYILLAPGTRTYPLSDSIYKAYLDTLSKSIYWRAIDTGNAIKIFERVASNTKP